MFRVFSTPVNTDTRPNARLKWFEYVTTPGDTHAAKMRKTRRKNAEHVQSVPSPSLSLGVPQHDPKHDSIGPHPETRKLGGLSQATAGYVPEATKHNRTAIKLDCSNPTNLG